MPWAKKERVAWDHAARGLHRKPVPKILKKVIRKELLRVKKIVKTKSHQHELPFRNNYTSSATPRGSQCTCLRVFPQGYKVRCAACCLCEKVRSFLFLLCVHGRVRLSRHTRWITVAGTTSTAQGLGEYHLTACGAVSSRVAKALAHSPSPHHQRPDCVTPDLPWAPRLHKGHLEKYGMGPRLPKTRGAQVSQNG